MRKDRPRAPTHLAEPQVAGPEVVGPLGDAVRLVDAGEGHGGQLGGGGQAAGPRRAPPAPHQGFGGQQQHVHLAPLHLRGERRLGGLHPIARGPPPGTPKTSLTCSTASSRCALLMLEWTRAARSPRGNPATYNRRRVVTLAVSPSPSRCHRHPHGDVGGVGGGAVPGHPSRRRGARPPRRRRASACGRGKRGAGSTATCPAPWAAPAAWKGLKGGAKKIKN